MEPRPFVFVNMAMTADGKIDTVARQGARISGPADTARVDRLRAGSDAIMVGARTLLSEDPRLTVRDPALVAGRQRAGRPDQPAKVGLVSHLAPGQLAVEGRFLREGGARVVVCTSKRTRTEVVDELRAVGAEVVVAGSERVDLTAALAALSAMGIERLMVEGGSTLVAALLEAGLVDELELAVAPLLFGGEAAPTPVGGSGWARDAAIDLRLIESAVSTDGDVTLRYGILATGSP
ncbi:MAG: dihydrofolate reductase family protein [Candidatus Limnocylindrales bacterium]